MSISQRINVLVGHFSGGNVSRFAAKLGFSEANVRNYINGTQPKADFFSKVIEVFEINAEWLLTGTGEMLKKDDLIPEEHLKEIQSSNRSDDFKQKEIEMWKELYRMQAELMDEIKKDRDRLKNLMEEKNKT